MNFDNQLYSVICRYRRDCYAAERKVEDMGRAQTVADIISGEVEDVQHVIEFNPAEGWSRVATADIAIEVAQKVGDSGNPIRPELYDFIERHAPHAARGLRVFDRSFWAA